MPDVRLFPLSLRMVDEFGGFEAFFTQILPNRTDQRPGQVAGRFNLGRKLDLRPSPSGTLVLFFVPRQRDAPPESEHVVAHARLGGGQGGPHREPDELSDENSIGYALLDPQSIVYLRQVLTRDDLPWRTGIHRKGMTRRLNLRKMTTWRIDSSPAEIDQYLRLAGGGVQSGERP